MVFFITLNLTEFLSSVLSSDKWLSGKLLEEQSSIDCFKCDWAFSNTEIYLHLELASELELDLQGLVYEMEC